MIIEMQNAEREVIPEFKGGVGQISVTRYIDGNNILMRGRLEPGSTVGFHVHSENSEVIYILSGKAKFTLDDGVDIAGPGQVHYCEMGHGHSWEPAGDEAVEFWAVIGNH